MKLNSGKEASFRVFYKLSITICFNLKSKEKTVYFCWESGFSSPTHMHSLHSLRHSASKVHLPGSLYRSITGTEILPAIHTTMFRTNKTATSSRGFCMPNTILYTCLYTLICGQDLYGLPRIRKYVLFERQRQP
jgi:hypothetical protein